MVAWNMIRSVQNSFEWEKFSMKFQPFGMELLACRKWLLLCESDLARYTDRDKFAVAGAALAREIMMMRALAAARFQ